MHEEVPLVGECIQCGRYLYEDSQFSLARTIQRVTSWGSVYDEELVCAECETENLTEGGDYV